MKIFLSRLQAGWRLLAATTLIGVIGASVAVMAATTVYTATATSFVSVNGRDSSVESALLASMFAQERVKSYEDVVTSDGVMIGVIEDLGLPMTAGELGEKISVNNPDDTVTLELSATDPNPVSAQSIANSAAEQLSKEVAQLETPSAGGEPLATINTVQPAPLPSSPSAPRKPVYLGIGALLGLAIGVGVVMGRGRRKADDEPVALAEV